MTGFPVGTGREKEVGANRLGMSLVFPALFFPMPADRGMPTSLQVITMYPFGLMRLPSQNVFCEAKKFMLHAYVRTQERYVVSGVYHHPDVGMDGIEGGSRRHMYVNPDHHGGMTVR